MHINKKKQQPNSVLAVEEEPIPWNVYVHGADIFADVMNRTEEDASFRIRETQRMHVQLVCVRGVCVCVCHARAHSMRVNQ